MEIIYNKEILGTKAVKTASYLDLLDAIEVVYQKMEFLEELIVDLQDEEDLIKFKKAYSNCFSKFNILSSEEQKILFDVVVRFEDGVPVYSEDTIHHACHDEYCDFPGTDIQTTYPQRMKTCPVCGTVNEKKLH